MRISHTAKLAMSIMAMLGGLAFVGSAQAEGVECKFVSTNDNSPLAIKVSADDTPEAKEFYKTCKNPYNKKYIADAEAAKAGKKKFGFYSCTQCHGANGGGQTGPSILDDRWQYNKHITDKGMFESIAGGTPAGMPAWHRDVSGNPELLPTDDILKIMGWLRASYKGGGETPWLKD